ncbi:MAG: T9SS type A sorting domain-containing protein, partial [Bacteroidota bacterium]
IAVYDKNGDFQAMLGGRWGPFALARSFSNSSSGGFIAPGLPVVRSTTSTQRGISPLEYVNLNELPDVDIVYTNDQSKWSRCLVVETSPTSDLGSGAWTLSAKWKDNVDKSGNSEGAKSSDDHGMSWFPGYAIDVNTGQRLNIFFGESEWDEQNNGNDMVFNPTNDLGTNLDRAGGRHYVYVTNLPYDGCEAIKDTLTNADSKGINSLSTAIYFPDTDNNLKDVYKYVAWVGIPLVNTGFDFTDPVNIPTDARVSLRTNQRFRTREGGKELGIFTFNTVDQAAKTNQNDVAKEALDDVLVVPNPYYAYSSYETGQLDNRVKITNLPQKCRISIFTLNGQLVQQFTKDSDEPDQDWDLKNQSGVPVASGVYIIHVDGNIDGQNLGEKIIKLFAVVRQVDLDNF